MRIGVRYSEPSVTSPEVNAVYQVVRETVFPKVQKFWSYAMSVRSMNKPLKFARECKITNGRCTEEAPSVCSARDGTRIKIPTDLLDSQTLYKESKSGWASWKTIQGGPGAKEDFMILVTVEDSDSCGDLKSGVLASAFACRWDECSRPTLGVVNVCPRALDPKSESSITSLFSTIAHEITHVFGFTHGSFTNMRHINGAPRIPAGNRKEYYYTCAVNDGVPRVQWDVSPTIKHRDPLYRFVVPEGIVTLEQRRGIGANCRCPLDPKKKYTSEDIEECLLNKHECAFVVTTPRVVAMSRLYFDCPTLTGPELENQLKRVSCSIIDSHWKERLLGDEYMTSMASNVNGIVSAITFGFLEDTGWYRMNYGVTTPVVPGSVYGYKTGCPFVLDKCFDDSNKVLKTLVNPKTFCTEDVTACSPDGTHKAHCSVKKDFDRSTIPRAYRFPFVGSQVDDFCPIFKPVSNGYCTDAAMQTDDGANEWELFGPTSHCLDVVYDNQKTASCFHMECFNDGSEYSISARASDGSRSLFPVRCQKAGQRIIHGDLELECLDPYIMCSLRDYAHTGDIRQVPSLPGSILREDSRLEAKQKASKIYSKQSGQVLYSAGLHP
jgi:leishmanolysin-like peptidase